MNYYHLSVLLHIIGLSIVACAALAGFLASRRFWHLYLLDRSKAEAVADLNGRFPRLFGIGMALLILSGVWLMIQTRGVYGEQLWFRIKILLVVLVIVNGVLTRRMGKKIQSLHAMTKTDHKAEALLLPMKRTTSIYYVTQLVLLVVIFTLGVFKFN